jgi:hypothetical protein
MWWGKGDTDAEVLVLGERIARGEFGMLTTLNLVSCAAFIAIDFS